MHISDANAAKDCCECVLDQQLVFAGYKWCWKINFQLHLSVYASRAAVLSLLKSDGDSRHGLDSVACAITEVVPLESLVMKLLGSSGIGLLNKHHKHTGLEEKQPSYRHIRE